MRKRIILPAVMVLFAGLAILFFIQSRNHFLFKYSSGGQATYERAVVTGVGSDNIRMSESGLYTGSEELNVKILTGIKKGSMFTIENFPNRIINFHVKTGDSVVVRVNIPDKINCQVSLYSNNRDVLILILLIIFFGSLILVAGKRGLRAILGLIFSFVIVFFIFMPMIYLGISPVLSGLLSCVMIITCSFFLLLGFGKKVIPCLVSTIAGLLTALLIITLVQNISMINGYILPGGDYMIPVLGSGGIRMGEVIFAAVLMSSLGAIMDVAVTITSAVWELRMNNKNINRKDLLKRGMNVGRDIAGMMSNTLLLVFTGITLGTVVVYYSLGYGFLQIVNSRILAADILEAIAGSIAVVVTVPSAALASAYTFGKIPAEG